MTPARATREECAFSIIIPTKDRPLQLSRCLASIAALRFPRDQFEVVVVNDGGEAPDEASIRSLAKSVSIQVISQPNRGPAAARNAGLSIACGEFMTLVDDDCVVPADWLDRLSEAVAAHPDSMIGGRTTNLLPDNLCSQASQRLVDYICRYYSEPATGRTPFFASNNITIRGQSLRAMGGFDESFRFTEDRDLCLRWHAQGGSFHYAGDVLVQHGHELSFQSYLQQHFNYGRGALPYRNRAKGDDGLRIEPLAFYSRMLASPFDSGDQRPAMIALLLIVAQVANAAGFGCEAARSVTRRRAGSPESPGNKNPRRFRAVSGV